MRKIIYYVASSLDGYIAGPNEDISGFVSGGDGVDQYLKDLQDFDTVIMGRRTYELGYQYGLKPGQAAYPHMEHYIFSTSLKFEHAAPKVRVCSLDIQLIKDLKAGKGTDIYLCGGGVFAGWLLEHELIDVLKIKLNPFVSGAGTPLFGASAKKVQLALQDQAVYEHGLQIITYEINY